LSQKCDVAVLDVNLDGETSTRFWTLALKMDGREPIGFKLKGFKNFYLHHLKDDVPPDADRDHFLALVKVIEKAIHLLGDKAFEEDRKAAYEQSLPDRPGRRC
jgi:hypothetical protein